MRRKARRPSRSPGLRESRVDQLQHLPGGRSQHGNMRSVNFATLPPCVGYAFALLRFCALA